MSAVDELEGGRAQDAADPVSTEVIRYGLEAAADHMRVTLCRTAVSPVIYEMQDFAAALFDRDMRLLAQARSMPGFLGTLGFAVEAMVDRAGGPETMRDGDVIFSTYGLRHRRPPAGRDDRRAGLPRRRAGRLRGRQGAPDGHRRQGPVLHRHVSATTARSPRIFSYVVARDFGFAPNPYYGWCSLATCKPEIRRRAAVGDWILGTGSARHGRRGAGVYAMRIEETLTFAEYWADPRFARKRPDLAGSRKRAFGDNIYRPDGAGGWHQLDSHHSFHDGRPNPLNVATDTRIDRVLISSDFIYWGGSGA